MNEKIFNPTSVKQRAPEYLVVPVLLTYLLHIEFFFMVLISLTSWNVHFPKFNLNIYFECILCVIL